MGGTHSTSEENENRPTRKTWVSRWHAISWETQRLCFRWCLSWIYAPCSEFGWFKRFVATYCLHLQGKLSSGGCWSDREGEHLWIKSSWKRNGNVGTPTDVPCAVSTNYFTLREWYVLFCSVSWCKLATGNLQRVGCQRRLRPGTSRSLQSRYCSHLALFGRESLTCLPFFKTEESFVIP